MDIRKELNSSITEMEKKFDRLVNENSLSIDDIEDLSLTSSKKCEQLINSHLEELLKKILMKKN